MPTMVGSFEFGLRGSFVVYCREMSTVVGHPYGHESLVKVVYCR